VGIWVLRLGGTYSYKASVAVRHVRRRNRSGNAGGSGAYATEPGARENTLARRRAHFAATLNKAVRVTRSSTLSLLAACLFAGCASRLAAEESPPVPKPAPSICLTAGPLACKAPPSGDKPTDLCAALKTCLANRTTEYGPIKQVDLCKVGSKISVAGGDITELIVVTAQVTVDMGDNPLDTDAAYLFARYPGGFCPVALLLEPFHAPNGCQDEFNLRWEPAADGGGAAKAIVQAQVESGAPDMYSAECVDADYRVRSGHVELASRKSKEDRCRRPAPAKVVKAKR
jgi:hypothetical protein